ncbi:MAG: hypothetical protein INR71_09945 [Terriglobus roseus]|nr:hypothetical protein [Terriglobus roseus]
MYAIQNAARSGQSISEGTSGMPSDVSAAAAAVESAKPPSTDSSTPAHDSATPESLLGTSLSQFRTRQQQQQGHAAPSEYYFYQALLHYYLSPLDIRILKEAFGNFSSFPSTILPRVEHVSTGHIVDDDLRRRIKYLAHLPYGCEVSFLECDWTDTVSPEVLERFRKDIEGRRKKNQDKDARDEKARLSAEQREEQRYAFARRRRGPSADRERFTADDFRPLNSEAGLSSSGEHISTSPPWSARRQQGSQFASLASPGTSPSASRTVWGTPAVASQSPQLDPVAHVPAGPQDDGWIQNWEEMLLQEDQLVAQAQSLALTGESSKAGAVSGGGSGVGGGGGGRKKKAKKITLMSTNVRRGA